MDGTGSRTWMVVVSLACFINLYNVHCSESTVYKTDNGLEQTIAVDRMPGKARKEMQQEILALLGLHHRPNPIKNNAVEKSAPQFMLELYKKIRSDDNEERPAINPSRFHSVLNNSPIPDIHEMNGSDLIMSFVNHGKDKVLEPEANLTVSKNFVGWLSIKVTNAANYWTVYRTENLGLYMRVTDVRKGRDIDPVKFGIVGEDGPENKQPFMVGFFKMTNELHLRPKRSGRKRQNYSPTEEEDTEDYYHWGEGGHSYSGEHFRRQACQRHTLYVSFKSLGWQDWVIAPDGYAAFYCGGECSFPLGAHLNATNHAIVQTLVHLYEPTEVPKPCCAPTQMTGISVLHFDDNSNVLLKIYKDMVVKSCGCH
ncbi:hypothetical protein ACJMK2_000255 [Sinanodonta woodiana]|uniref:TGF-beta family profile domain-containing protein n=1 Tax=Sinanodonta woodiana TaxID=1069815 RepID=A0ABD3XQK9_SINWO